MLRRFSVTSRPAIDSSLYKNDLPISPTPNLAAYVESRAWSFSFPTDGTSWIILSPIEQSIKSKIEEHGIPLGSLNLDIKRGILTGLNEAFIIDGATKNRLIKEDPKSAEIIRPILRGRDIVRYGYSFADKWLISTFPALHLDIDDYPVVRDYLLSFDKRILEQSGEHDIDGIKGKNARKRTGNAWFETQDQIAYWSLFSQPKIVWGEISDKPKFAFDETDHYVPEATTFFMVGELLPYLCIYLNSALAEYLFALQGTTTGVGTVRWKKYKLEQLYVPRLPFTATEMSSWRTSELQNIQDDVMRRVYSLLDFSPEEIELIENHPRAHL